MNPRDTACAESRATGLPLSDVLEERERRAALEPTGCGECGRPFSQAGQTATHRIYRCTRGHTWSVPKRNGSAAGSAVAGGVAEGKANAEASGHGTPPVGADRVELPNPAAVPPDTSRDRTSYCRPKPFGPTSLAGKVLEWLREPPHQIDHHEAERRWNHTRLAATIHTLRTNGYQFETLEGKGLGGVAVYRLLNPRHGHL
jgi:hypothetical protein